MEDDIDIEEHDIMDNPVIRNLFPDVSVIKKEIEDYFIEDSQAKQPELNNIQMTTVKKELQYNGSTTDQTICHPDTQKDEPSTSDILFSHEKVIQNTYTDIHFCTKVILGTKPHIKLTCNENNNESFLLSSEVKVVLEDLNKYINSNTFCYDCKIFFFKMDAFENHCNEFHSSMKKTNISKSPNNLDSIGRTCNICGNIFSSRSNLIRHMQNIHSTKTSRKEYNSGNNTYSSKIMSSTESQNNCLHCDLVFPSKQLLVEHMYDVLQTKNMSTVDKVKPTKPEIPKQTTGLKKQNNSRKGEIKHTEDILLSSSRPKKCNKFYFCKICCKYFIDSKIYLKHMKNIHKENLKWPSKGVPFNSRCKYCHSNLSTFKSYNKHMYRFHSKQSKGTIQNNEKLVESSSQKSLFELQDKRDDINIVPYVKLTRDNEKGGIPVQCKEQHIKNNNKIAAQKVTQSTTVTHDQENHVTSSRDISEDEIVLKSFLFKCNKCDIHFLSAHTASNHLGHMELLINWKCFTCQRVFKNQDKSLHEQQHLYSQTFTVHDVTDQESTSILFSCWKCNVHFAEENLKPHYETCGSEVPQTKHCIECDVLVDGKTTMIHNKHHRIGINIKLIRIERHEILHNKITKLKEELIAVAKESKNEPLRIKERKPCISFMYCSTCKCFLRNFNNGPHLKSECANFRKYICRHCGLYFTATTMKIHIILHRKNKNLKLQDFSFTNLRTRKNIPPPIPTYMSCAICGIHFINKRELNYHLCNINEGKYLTCKVCGLKFFESAYKVHMPFHFYSMDRIPKVKNYRNTIVDVKYNTMNSESDIIISPKLEVDNLVHEDSSFHTPEKTETIRSNSTDIEDPSYINNIVYCCQKCNFATLTYNKVVEHCHAHYDNKLENEKRVICSKCNNYLFEYNEYSIHLKQHSSEKLITFQKYDDFYFAYENREWTKHVLSNLPEDIVNAILENSIYRYEHKFKMEIIQDGPSDLSLYKCYRCNIFVNPINIHKHSILNCKINMFRIRKHICSHCGLPFISSTYRQIHENGHKRRNMNQKSYRIILFNKARDNEYNKALSRNVYVLYQCRSCDGIVDNKTYTHHKCNINDLTKCLSCGLLLYVDQYDLHIKKHKDYKSFIPNNMKVIFIGDKGEENKDSNIIINKLLSTYNGNQCDYTYYMCTKCKFCTKRKSNHTCLPCSENYLCCICNLYFYKNNYHRKLHEGDIDYIRENMRIIPFNPEKIENSSESEDEVANKNNNDKNHEIATEAANESNLENTNIITEKIARIYKCVCGLHFLDEANIEPHLKQCGSVKISKQVCSKCDILFTPNVLFNHLLIHHGDKNCLYKYDIVKIER